MQEVNLIGKLSTGGSYVPVIASKNITENGTYRAPEGVDGYNPITVRVSGGGAVIEPKTITENGTYEAPEGVDGYNPIDVLVSPLLEDRYINANGQYGPTEGYDGIRRLTVEVPVPSISPLTISENGTYTDPSGNGYNPITVNVPSIGNVVLADGVFYDSNGFHTINYNFDPTKYYGFMIYDDGFYVQHNKFVGGIFIHPSNGSTYERFYFSVNGANYYLQINDTSFMFSSKLASSTTLIKVVLFELNSDILTNLIP